MSTKKPIATKTLRAKTDDELLKELKTLRVNLIINKLGRITKYQIYKSCWNIRSKNLKNKSKTNK